METEYDDLYYQLGRASADTWSVYEQEERANLEWFRSLGDTDLASYALGRLSTLDDKSEVDHDA